MNKSDLIRLRTKIVAMLGNLEVTAASARSEVKESSETSPNAYRDVSDSVKGEIDLRNAVKVHNINTAQQGLLRGALARIETGTYGMCVDCGEEISLRRLEALPSAALCVLCQQANEYGYERDLEPKKTAVQVRCAA